MSSLINKLISDDFVWNALVNNLHGDRRKSSTNFLNINCPMCVSRGESQDTKFRCGIKNNNPGIGVSCFNCGFKTLWKVGELISKPMQDFLENAGMSVYDVKKLNHKALTYRSMFSSSEEAMALLPEVFMPDFNHMSLPRGSKSFTELANTGCTNPDFIDVASYLYTRGDTIVNGSEYYWSPDKAHDWNRRIIIPFYYNGTIVGYTGRSVDELAPNRYKMETPSNYLFNNNVLHIQHRKYVILVEGVFDAIAVDGIGLMGARLNTRQVSWIKSSGKTIILVPDRDTRGQSLIDVAIANDWYVSFPAFRSGHGKSTWWDSDVKDAAEASKRYGQLWTVLSIIESATDQKTKISTLRKFLF